MAITTTFDQAKKTLTVHISGRFDFNILHDFRKAYESQGPLKHYILDFKEAEFMDSSALGMLLTMRDYAGGDDSDIQIVNANADICKVIKVTKLDDLFTLIEK